MILIVFYLIVIFGEYYHSLKISVSEVFSLKIVIHSCVTLRCYSCRGGKQCGILFSSKSSDIKLIYGNDLYDSCSVSIDRLI